VIALMTQYELLVVFRRRGRAKLARRDAVTSCRQGAIE
jgi:hypothetical protein